MTGSCNGQSCSTSPEKNLSFTAAQYPGSILSVQVIYCTRSIFIFSIQYAMHSMPLASGASPLILRIIIMIYLATFLWPYTGFKSCQCTKSLSWWSEFVCTNNWQHGLKEHAMTKPHGDSRRTRRFCWYEINLRLAENSISYQQKPGY